MNLNSDPTAKQDERPLAVVGSEVKDHLNWTTTGGYPTIINIGCPDLAKLEP